MDSRCEPLRRLPCISCWALSATKTRKRCNSFCMASSASVGMLKSVGVKTVILGHSERRAYFNETDSLLAKKIDTALAHNMRAIFCFGEELEDRKSGNEEGIVEAQIKNA